MKPQRDAMLLASIGMSGMRERQELLERMMAAPMSQGVNTTITINYTYDDLYRLVSVTLACAIFLDTEGQPSQAQVLGLLSFTQQACMT